MGSNNNHLDTIDIYSAYESGLAVASYELGSGFGALSLLLIGDRLGRRRSVFVAEVVVLLGIALQATSFKLPQLITARAIMSKLIPIQSVCEWFS